MRKNSPLPKSLGKRIKKARKSADLTQAELADLLDVTSTYVGFIEQGRSTPSLELLDKLAKKLRVKLADLL